jgi:aarF domain-containing kinase
MTALAPAAFLKLAEDNDGQGKTAEMQMLEASREEVRKTVSPDAQGLSKLCQTIWVYFYYYVYDPIATGFRFMHLAIIFIPVVAAVPAIWIGRKVQDHDGARTGTLWWYRFLVKAMERAGPAFIKVSSLEWQAVYCVLTWTARAMGRIANRYLPS